jgi:N6-L-threonylcarbamoyladenine synthase
MIKILAIDTSCDETCAAVTEGTRIISNVIWSQASAHAKFGGVMPSLAQRMHEERIDWVIKKALGTWDLALDIDAIAVTTGPGLSIALGVGVNKAREIAIQYHKKLIAVNHLEGHILSPLAISKSQKSAHFQNINFPAYGLVVSGGNTLFVKVISIGKYETLAQTTDDALGEALDKGARMLGLGYPGGAILEKMARLGESGKYSLPTPIVGQEERRIFTYSGLKTAMNRLVESQRPLTKSKIYNLAYAYQDKAFIHLLRVISHVAKHAEIQFSNLLVGGGVSANLELRKRLRKFGKEFGIHVYFPYSNKLIGDNAAMIGIAAHYLANNRMFIDPSKIDRYPSLKIDG